mmetsp:Transcript_2046/g.7347  ORF Transcript_2046/g.7347 Transcript_2046/m.7347 type:complete len:163 (+) Transcript_2046:1202-1690(+)
MGRFQCTIDFESENLSEITLKAPENTIYVVRAKCTNCGEEHPKELHVDPNAELPLPMKGNRGSTNCVFKCKFCERQSYIDVVPSTFTSFNSNDGTKFSVCFDARGCDVTQWEVNPADLKAVGEGGQEFEEIDTLQDWADYDEDAGEQVAIYDVKHSVKSKGK